MNFLPISLQEYSLQVTLREQWMDERLKFNDSAGEDDFIEFQISELKNVFVGNLKYLALTETNRIWMPDLFFGNEKESHFHNTLMPNVLVYIFPSGAIQYSIRISLTLSCPMDFKLYPFDRQYCPLRMSSCTY